MNELRLRQLIRLMLESADSKDKDNEGPDDLITEPDTPPNEEDETMEASVVGAAGGTASSGAMRGVSTPLGTGPTHPSKSKKKKKTSKKRSVGVSSFGGGSRV